MELSNKAKNLNEIKKIAKKTGDAELLKDVKKRIKTSETKK